MTPAEREILAEKLRNCYFCLENVERQKMSRQPTLSHGRMTFEDGIKNIKSLKATLAGEISVSNKYAQSLEKSKRESGTSTNKHKA